MNLKSFFLNKKILLLVLFIVIFLASSVLEPIVRSNTEKNWDRVLTEEVEKAEEKILEVFQKKYSLLLKVNRELKERVDHYSLKNNLSKCFDILNEYKYYSIEIYDNDANLLCWNSRQSFDDEFQAKFKRNLSQAFFRRDQLFTYLTIVDTINHGGNYYSIVSIPLEKHYKLAKEKFESVSLSDSLSSLLSTFVEIEYDPNAALSKDGRKHSFQILNNYNNKIGVASIEKPAIDVELKKISSTFSSIQNVLFVFIILTVGYLFRPHIKRIQHKALKFSLFVALMIIVRIILFLFNIPSGFIDNNLTSASNFSSTFAFGVVRSPLEFFITLIFILIIAWVGFIYFVRYSLNKVSQTAWVKLIVIIISTFFVLLIYRGLGASIRSVVFDSSIRYFKEFTFIPPLQIFLMNINILILGFICLLLSTILVLWIRDQFKIQNRKYALLLGTFLFVQIAGFLFDALQKQPQGTPVIRVLFLLIVFILSNYFYGKKVKLAFYVYTAISASIITISLLSFYNSEIERESLKTTAYELTNSDEDILKFILFQTLVDAQSDKDIINCIEKNKDQPAAVFSFWTKSLIYKRNIPSDNSLFDNDGKLLGHFSTSGTIDSLDKNLLIDVEKPGIKQIRSTYSSMSKLVGVTPIKSNDQVVGYFSCSFENNVNEPIIKKVPTFIASSRAGISSATDIERLKIFYLEDGEIINSFGTPGLNQNEANMLRSVQFNKYNEAWLQTSINREENIVYVLRYDKANNRSIAVALEMSEIALRLTNFFKIFFIHSLLIFAALFVYSLFFIKSWREYLSRYRTKLTFVLILVSVFPLVIIAVYFRNVSDVRNRKNTNDRLTEYALQIESYMKKYSSSAMNNNVIYQKANNDLNIDFNVYQDKTLVYSTKENLYQVGLFSNILNPVVYQRCIVNDSEKTFVEEFTDQTKFFAVYKTTAYPNSTTLIEVNDLFNKSSFSLTEDEPGLFLFGIFSLGLIILIVLSTVLARQISSPINKLTMATKSVGSGDLNVIVVNKSSGEIEELTSGFNKMVEQLKKSQVELAQLERETAWKEMAKQVAHEIKNPLTPMKLSVQQLIASYNDRSNKFDEIFNKVTATLLTQIEILKNIASEFSNFARMPKPNIERINLSDIVEKAISLFIDDRQKINYRSSARTIFVNADNDQMSRTIINLIRNSIQANANNIFIELKSENNFAEIKIIDNGEGIDPDNISRVFDENFTTKAKGMGLGLSMAKKFIEAIEGTIEIEQTSREGTSIIIKIPATN